jgi:hypothetical protein
LGFGIWSLGFGAWGVGFEVWGLGLGDRGLGFGVEGSRFKVWILGFGVGALGFRIWVLGCPAVPLHVVHEYHPRIEVMLPLPRSGEHGIFKTVTARFWPRAKVLKPFQGVPSSLESSSGVYRAEFAEVFARILPPHRVQKSPPGGV